MTPQRIAELREQIAGDKPNSSADLFTYQATEMLDEIEKLNVLLRIRTAQPSSEYGEAFKSLNEKLAVIAIDVPMAWAAWYNVKDCLKIVDDALAALKSHPTPAKEKP
jgi:hypothetical protein